MIGLLLTLGIIVSLGINLSIYGTSAWGFSPGGKLSAVLYGLQILISLGGLAWLVIHTLQARGTTRFYALGLTFAIAGFAGIAYLTTGWRIATSGHYQGTENLIPFLLTTSGARVT